MVLKRDLDIILDTKANWNKLKNSNVLVTGATGRLGIYIAQALIELNDRKQSNIGVYLLARSKEKLENSYGNLLNRSDVHVLQQDVTAPIKVDANIDYIFHTAGLASPSDFTYRPIDTLWGHVQGTKNVLDLASEKKTKKVLYVSTVEIYGTWTSEEGIKENDMGPLDCFNFRACYPEAKRLCETMLACYEYEKHVDYVSIRMSHTLGPGVSLNDGRAFAEFIRKTLNDEDIVLESDGSAERKYTYVADAVGAMFLALLNGTEHSYNVANVSNLISIKKLADLIASFSKTKKTKVVYSSPDKALAYLPFKLGVLDSSKIIKLGWTPKIDVETLFKWTYESFEK